jgi:hypothetical protein
LSEGSPHGTPSGGAGATDTCSRVPSRICSTNPPTPAPPGKQGGHAPAFVPSASARAPIPARLLRTSCGRLCCPRQAPAPAWNRARRWSATSSDRARSSSEPSSCASGRASPRLRSQPVRWCEGPGMSVGRGGSSRIRPKDASLRCTRPEPGVTCPRSLTSARLPNRPRRASSASRTSSSSTTCSLMSLSVCAPRWCAWKIRADRV